MEQRGGEWLRWCICGFLAVKWRRITGGLDMLSWVTQCVCVCLFLDLDGGAQWRMMSVWSLFYLRALFSWGQSAVFLRTKSGGRWLSAFSSIPPSQVTSIFHNIPFSVCVYCTCVCEVPSSSHGLIERTFLLSKLNYSAPLFISPPVPLFPVYQLPLFLSRPKTCAHKSADPKNRGTITCVFIWVLCEVAETHSERCDLGWKSGSNRKSIAGRNPPVLTRGWKQLVNFVQNNIIYYKGANSKLVEGPLEREPMNLGPWSQIKNAVCVSRMGFLTLYIVL